MCNHGSSKCIFRFSCICCVILSRLKCTFLDLHFNKNNNKVDMKQNLKMKIAIAEESVEKPFKTDVNLDLNLYLVQINLLRMNIQNDIRNMFQFFIPSLIIYSVESTQRHINLSKIFILQTILYTVHNNCVSELKNASLLSKRTKVFHSNFQDLFSC